MVDFQTIKSEEIKFGNNNFIEVARKKAVSDEGENVFVSLSRGFTTPTGEKRYRKSFTVPMQKNVIDFVSEQIKVMGEGATEAPEEPAAEQPQEEAQEEKE